MLIILKPIFLQDNIFLIPLSIIFYVNGQKFQTFLSIDFCTQKNQLDDSWFLLYLQNYIHADISLRFILPAILGQALTRLVTVSSMCYHTSTSALSTSSSSRGFTSLRMGYLILRGASRLDAFSVYPFRAWLLGRRLGSLTGTPAVRPSRSSRTKDSSSQISYAHAG